MEQITGIGLPFPPDYSSCSNLPPKLFKWISGPSTIKIYIDGAIDQGLLDRATPTKFGWLCESRDICDDQYRKIKSNIESMTTTTFEALEEMCKKSYENLRPQDCDKEFSKHKY